jgi:hypothetical protein
MKWKVVFQLQVKNKLDLLFDFETFYDSIINVLCNFEASLSQWGNGNSSNNQPYSNSLHQGITTIIKKILIAN